MEEMEPVAHMIDVEPVLVLNCSASELKICALLSLGFWLLFFLIIFLILGIDVLKIILVPLISLFLSAFTTYFTAKYIGKTKRGKPHSYYMHMFEMKYLSKIRKTSYMNYQGYFCLERSSKPGVDVVIQEKE